MEMPLIIALFLRKQHFKFPASIRSASRELHLGKKNSISNDLISWTKYLLL